MKNYQRNAWLYPSWKRSPNSNSLHVFRRKGHILLERKRPYSLSYKGDKPSTVGTGRQTLPPCPPKWSQIFISFFTDTVTEMDRSLSNPNRKGIRSIQCPTKRNNFLFSWVSKIPPEWTRVLLCHKADGHSLGISSHLHTSWEPQSTDKIERSIIILKGLWLSYAKRPQNPYSSYFPLPSLGWRWQPRLPYS